MQKLHADIVDALRKLADKLGDVNASYEEIATHIGSGTTADEVHQGLLGLDAMGHLPGDPTFTSETFFGRAPGGGAAFFDQLKAALRARGDRRGSVNASYKDIATDVGCSAGEVHQGIVHLNDDYYFDGEPMILSDMFEVALPEEN